MKALLHKLAIVATLLLAVQGQTEDATGKGKSTEYNPPAVLRQFIQYNYSVVGGNTKKGELYRARIEVFEENGKLLVRRTRNSKVETVELEPQRDYPESLPTWVAHFKNEKIQVCYVLRYYHDNTPLLVGHVSRDVQGDDDEGETVETAYPYTPINQGEPSNEKPPKAAHAEANDVEFSATINEIKNARQFDKETIVMGVDPRFVVRLTLEQDVEGIGKRGDSVSFAIHSPARDLRIPDQRAAVGTRIQLLLGRLKEGGFKSLRRAETNKGS